MITICGFIKCYIRLTEYRKAFFVLFFGAFFQLIQAQDSNGLDSLIDLALSENLTVKTLDKRVEHADLELKKTKFEIIPKVSANLWNGYANGRYYDPQFNQFILSPTVNGSMGLTVSWELYNGGYFAQKSKQDQNSIFIAELLVEKKKKDLTKEIITLYAEINKSIQLLDLYSKKNQLYALELKRLEELFNHEKISYLAVSQIQVLNRITEEEYLQQCQLLEEQLFQLSLLTGQEITNASSIISDTTTNKDWLEKTQLLSLNDSLKYQEFTRYQLGEKEVKRAQINSELQKTSSRPQISLESGVYSGYSNNLATTTVGNESLLKSQLGNNAYQAVSVNVHFPIFSAPNKIAKQQAKIEEEVSHLLLEEIEQRILFKYQTAQKLLQIKYHTLQSVKAQLDQVSYLSSGYQKKFDANRLPFDQLLAIKEKQLNSEILYCQRYFDCYKEWKLFELDYLN